jgi:hypothetical protein
MPFIDKRKLRIIEIEILIAYVGRLKAQLDGAWLCSFYLITDVTDKESYSNAPCIRPGAARCGL